MMIFFKSVIKLLKNIFWNIIKNFRNFIKRNNNYSDIKRKIS